MIRINLLPNAKKASRSRATATDGNSQGWFIGYAVVSAFVVTALAFWYVATTGELEEQNSRNQELQAEIDSIKQKSAQIEEVKKKIAASKKLDELVEELNKARLGPTRVMMELSRILSVNGGPTIDLQELERLRRENPLAGFNRTWDPRRVWLSSFQETKRKCRIRGRGRTNEDISEFMRRLNLSEVFENVRLLRTESGRDSETRLQLISFELTAEVKY